MRSPLEVSDIHFHPAAPDQRAKGLHGWVLCVLNGVVILDSLAIRRNVEGRFVISFPGRIDAGGKRHPYFQAATPAARAAIESQVLRELAERGLLE